ncbi:hypothetical protein FSP39_001019 [Pinctada imbricata]|uniref:Mitochondria-eating protein C-terminal domain-containing protein n=1 Tax=Pinctada imbricata TaxID=66713 RepID=A0AA88YKS4_PINIB|nr:hypothetical protein FSP39_001019 [Pinctada imbricata]
MSAVLTPKLDELFASLADNSPISNKLIQEAQQEYKRLRTSAVQHERKSREGSRRESVTQRDAIPPEEGNLRTPEPDICPHCKKDLGTEKLSEISRLRKELYLKTNMCKDLQEQLRYYRQQSKQRMRELEDSGTNKQNMLQKLARRYNDLYENEWKWAFDFMDNQLNIREDKILETLLRIFRVNSGSNQAAYKFCDDIARTQIANIEGEMLCPLSTWTEYQRIQYMNHLPNLPLDTTNRVKEYRISTSTECVPSLQEAFLAHILPEFVDHEQTTEQTIASYAKGCVYLCWMICIQDPPLILVTKVNRREHFDIMRFRHYIKNGDQFDFVVWPALLSSSGQSILCKGVAQALESDRSKATFRRSLSPSGVSARDAAPSPKKSPNAAIRGTPWGSQQFSNRGTPSVELPPFPDEDEPKHTTSIADVKNGDNNGRIHRRTVSLPGADVKGSQVGQRQSNGGRLESPSKESQEQESKLTSAWKERHQKMKPMQK